MWWLRGRRGWLRVRILATPESVPTVQALDVTAVVDPSPALAEAGAALLGAAAVGPELPGGLDVAPAFDAQAWARAAQAGSARFGAMTLGLPMAGDGEATATWRLTTERGGRAELRVALDRETGALAEAALRVGERAAPPEGW
ncbi:MAG: hypothetical protein U0838_13250 [Chloroflexota bacterium]